MKKNTHQGHQARKRFGQNFLHDLYIIESIVDAISPKPGENIVEIGPGLGALTQPVAREMGPFTVIELDRDLAQRLQTHPQLSQQLTIHQADAMQFDFKQLVDPAKGKLRVFGNLPYNISTPLMFHLFTYHQYIQDMHFMLQKEVVKRLAAGPGSKAYGRLTVMAQYFCQVIPVLEVPPEAFVPPPKVDSAVVRLIPYTTLPHQAKDFALFERVCREAFAQRRKTIRNCYKRLLPDQAYHDLSIDPSLRPEQLSLAQFVAIANWLSGMAAVDQTAQA